MKSNQKGFVHFIVIFFLVLIMFSAIFIKYNSYKNKIKAPKTIIVPTESQVSPTSEPVQNKWLSYKDPVAGFTLDYPEDWSYKIIEETKVQPTDENGATGFVGQIEFVGSSGNIILTFGDGFGGAPCGEVDSLYPDIKSETTPLSDGKIENFMANNQEIVQCKIQSSELNTTSDYTYTWVGSCGNCGLVHRSGTSFVFDFNSDTENLSTTNIPNILSSFKLTP